MSWACFSEVYGLYRKRIERLELDLDFESRSSDGTSRFDVYVLAPHNPTLLTVKIPIDLDDLIPIEERVYQLLSTLKGYFERFQKGLAIPIKTKDFYCEPNDEHGMESLLMLGMEELIELYYFLTGVPE